MIFGKVEITFLKTSFFSFTLLKEKQKGTEIVLVL